jgi:DNA-binding CsgD family transcriptional regulator
MSPGIARKAMALLAHATLEKEKEAEPLEIILKLLVARYDYQVIAEKLFISPNTVRKHIGNVYQKLHVNSKVQAIWLAMKKGWVLRLRSLKKLWHYAHGYKYPR